MLVSRLVFVLLSAGFCAAQNGAPANQEVNRMDQIVRSYVDNKQFMGTALVARGDQVLFSKGYGYANLEWNVPNAPDTKFRLGSVTKQFTAASILLLEERGKLNINDPVKKYLPDAPSAWDRITIYHLLTHTSGVPNFTSFPDYAKLEPFAATPEQLVARFRDRALDFQPGEKWNYSNSGYVLLTLLLEKVSGESYEKFVRENIFSPLGMKDSGYDSNSAVIPHRAAGYTPGKNGVENAGFIHMSIPQGAGALYSTTEDLLKWEVGLFGGKLLKPATLAKMTTPFKDNYALGLQVETVAGHKAIQHGGGIEGFNTNLAYYPDDKLTVVVLGNLNSGAPGEISGKLASVARGETVRLPGERKEITLDPAALGRFVGAYQLGPGANFLITLDGKQLFSKLGNQPALALFAESENLFFVKEVDATIEFPKDEKGPASQLTLHQNGRDMNAKRLDDAETKKLMDAAAAFTKRFKDQTAAPGSEAALRRLIGEVASGKPNYDLMSTGLATATRQQLPQMQASLTQLGALKNLTFKGVGPGGADIYQARFENGSLEYRIWLAADGKVEAANMRPE